MTVFSFKDFYNVLVFDTKKALDADIKFNNYYCL